LKGARSLIGAPGELPIVNPTGTPAMATAGAGDVLSGVLAANLAALRDPLRAACVAAYLHGASGELWASAHGSDRRPSLATYLERYPAPSTVPVTGVGGSLPV
jgi:NAD(P)H-hydrate repair Nnr-like enzyme with NAD(P)H-hydrate dehydratase domain